MKFSIGSMDLQKLQERLEQALGQEREYKKPKQFPRELVPGKDIFPQQRDQAVTSMIRLCDKFRFYPETLALSVNILDRILSSARVNPRYLPCILATSIYLAAKLQEENEAVPGTLEFVRSTQCGCTVSEVLRMERVILDKLHWQLSSCTALDFLHIFHAMLLSNNPHLFGSYSHLTPAYQLSALTSKLKICFSHHQLMEFRPATLALAVLSLEMEFYTNEWLPAVCYIQQLTDIDSGCLIRCRELVSSFLSDCQYKNIVYRFSPEAVNKRAKRHLSESDDPNMYDGIKRLYSSDDSNDSISSMAKISPVACSFEVQQLDETGQQCPPLKPVEAN